MGSMPTKSIGVSQHQVPDRLFCMLAGAVNAVISEERGSLTTEESIKIPLNALADPSLSVRKTALQDIRNILHQHRSWLVGLLPANTPADGTAAHGRHALLLSSLLGALLKCCDPEVTQQQPQAASGYMGSRF